MKVQSPSSVSKVWLTGFRLAVIITLVFSAFAQWNVTTVFADKLVCGVPGKDGPVSLGGIVNTYYPGTANVVAGSTSISVGSPSGAASPIQAGDLLLVIQMQGADINSTNTGAYGDGVAGDPAMGLLASNFSAGLYEYVVATSAVVSNSVSISSGLVNNYFAQDYPVGVGNQGQRRFQVIRVPQYSSATITSSVTSLPWNGSVGGVVAIDVAGTLNFNGNNINVNGQGFRGGGGVIYTGDGAGTTFLRTDYRTPSTSAMNASKGEGVAGTPRYIFNGTSVSDLGIEGYPNGSFARGAPGNAGGGGTDGQPIDNQENTGGGGGGNGGAGGTGGFGWANIGSTISQSGGFGGAAFPATASRLVMGGGGGAGTINNNDPVISSGGAGGGVVMVRAGTITGNGTVNANGADGQDQLLNDSGGGGGAGGSVMIVAQGSLPAGLNVSADGGEGGDAWPGMPNAGWPSPSGWRHGPGGGGGGGVIFLNGTAGTLSVTGGANGITTTDNDVYGSNPGLPGTINTTTVAANVTTGISGAECIPTPTVLKTTSTPLVTQTPTGTTGEYTIVVSIPADQGTALGFSISDSLPTGFTYDSTVAINLSGGAVRVNTVNPTSGTSTPSWGTFDIPGGGQVEITFAVNIDASVPAGVYQNPATATYTDPTRTVPNGTTDSQYDPSSSTGEDIEVVIPSTPELTLEKTADIQTYTSVGQQVTYTYTLTNTGTVILTAPYSVNDDKTTVDCSGAASPLSSGQSTTCVATYTITVDDIQAGSVTNQATATATFDGTNVTSNQSSVTINYAALNIIKEVSVDNVVWNDTSVTVNVGDPVYYRISVGNIGNVILTGLTVDDGMTGCTLARGIDNPGDNDADFEPGEIWVYTCSVTAVAGTQDNTATADSIETGQASDNASYFGQNPGIQIVKSSDASGTNVVGDTITYTYGVTNTSNVILTNVAVTDAHAGLSAIICTPAQGSSLVPGGTMTCTATYTVTQADVNAGQIDNTGVVTGTPPTGPDVTDNDILSVPVGRNPQLDVVKSQTSNGPYVVDDTISYNIVVTNTGNITLTGVTVSDNSAVLGACVPVQPATLDPGASMTCAATHVVTAGDLDTGSYTNTATGDSNETPPSDSTVIIDFGIADLSLVKTVTNTTPNVSTNINFILTVTNSGPEDAVGVEVADQLPSGFTFISATASRGTYNSTTGIWQIGNLALNESVTLNMTVRVNTSGPYTNTAEVAASLLIDPDSTPNNQVPGEDDQSSVTVNPRNPTPPTPTPSPTPVVSSNFLIPVTGFAPNVVTDISRVPSATYVDTTVMLDIPALSVNIPIVGVPKKDGTWNVSWLGNEAGWLEGSAFPSWNGNSVLTSHVYLSNGKPGPFAKLYNLKTGDQVIVHAYGQSYIFEVQTNAIVSPTDRSVMKHEEKPWITLVTCANYDPKTGTYKNRFIVRAVLVKVTND